MRSTEMRAVGSCSASLCALPSQVYSLDLASTVYSLDLATENGEELLTMTGALFGLCRCINDVAIRPLSFESRLWLGLSSKVCTGRMGFKGTTAEKKVLFDKKKCDLLEQGIRKGLRPESVILMGKNTIMKRTICIYCEKSGNSEWPSLISLLEDNVGLIFTKGALKEVREEIAKYKVGAPARVGLVAPIDVVVPPGNTGLDSSQTSFFQVLNIPTKINKGTVEMVAPMELIRKGENVGSSEAALLAKIEYNPRLITYEQLLDTFWSNHDPTQFFGQGPDVGSQYRSAVFFNGTEQEKLAYASKKRNQANLVDGLLTTEIKKLGAFYPAEPEHQKFELRRKRPILQVFGDVADEEFLKSHAATKLNAYAAGMCPLSTQRQLDNMMDTILTCRTNAWKMFINALG